MSNIESITMMVMSTAHLTGGEARRLEAAEKAGTFREVCPIWGFAGQHGWLFFVDEEFPYGVTEGNDRWPGLCSVLVYAHSKGFDWVRLDEGAGQDDCLPRYDW